jgi:hypothetical protein
MAKWGGALVKETGKGPVKGEEGKGKMKGKGGKVMMPWLGRDQQHIV